MTAWNCVRMKVKPGKEAEFEKVHRDMHPDWAGWIEGAVIKTGERTYCIIGKWTSMDALAAARPKMIGVLDSMRPLLEDLGGGLGLTDPVSGPAVVEINAR